VVAGAAVRGRASSRPPLSSRRAALPVLPRPSRGHTGEVAGRGGDGQALDPAGAFGGFGADLVEFYEGLAADNSRDYWAAHRDTYQQSVQGPLRALAEALSAEFGDIKVFRPNRDLRFTPDKRPYTEHASMVAKTARGGGLYFQVGPDGLLLAGGWYQPAPDSLDRWRHAMDDDAVVDGLRSTLMALAAVGFTLDEGDPVTTAPRGWRRDHRHIDLIRRRSLTVSRTDEPGAWWSTPQCLDRVREGWTACRDWTQWLEDTIGATTRPATGDSVRAPRGRRAADEW